MEVIDKEGQDDTLNRSTLDSNKTHEEYVHIANKGPNRIRARTLLKLPECHNEKQFIAASITTIHNDKTKVNTRVWILSRVNTQWVSIPTASLYISFTAFLLNSIKVSQAFVEHFHWL